MDETLKLKGSLTIEIKRADGTVEVRRKDNMILNAGFDFLCDAIGNSSRPALMNYIAVGTSSTASVETQTGLASEIARKTATYSHTNGTKQFSLAVTFGAGEASGAITEAGVCNASTGGAFLDRATFAVVNKGADDEVRFTFRFTFS